MKVIISILLFFVSLMFSHTAFAFGEFGHVTICEIEPIYINKIYIDRLNFVGDKP